MRASRLVSILLLLQTRGRMTAQELADRLEVSVRTIYRDVESLHSAGIPLYGDAGPKGGYQLLDGYRTRLTGLTADEAESLFLAGLPGPAAELGLGAVVTAAQLKLMAALPVELRDRAGRIQERFHLDAPTWYRDQEPVTYLPAVADAVWNERRIQVRYRRWKAPQEVERRLEPYGLVVKAGRWYLVARSEGDVRTYRVSQILDLHPLPERFTRAEGFDLTAYWAGYLAEFEARLRWGEAVARVSPEGLRRLTDLMTPGAVKAAHESAQPPDEEGWIQVTVPIESIGHALGEFLRLGTEAEVLSPAELRDQVGAAAREIAARYR
ncbi:Predicted DNA-binding transcriptional regulator YafY, contains an HTH and WYL domains [Nonomuraea solani]|uniref:Predicted DNA-binding transcriptional regulator YafY, contains an HTH and WYL domains n=1 Tax=Nonomuraea solani TaxID=1144553 RepID=A0A1H6F1P5_9ACTN|nr:YafY family protein [Nonomuraea solani]SEH02854.1 Predicted DNA-binding transcriptional regulator YafY, contains an HTH and WYL domains [Nonomuraea solani]